MILGEHCPDLGNLIGRQILGPHSKPAESETEGSGDREDLCPNKTSK